MTVIFLLPLALSVVAVLMFAISEMEFGWKILAGVLAVAAVTMQFVPPVASQVHFLVPLGIQLFLSVWLVLWAQMP